MRISGITIPDKKRLDIGLTAIYGIGRPRARYILESLKIDPSRKATEVTPDEENSIREYIEKKSILIEGDLRREVGSHIKRLKDIGSYRGSRHSKKLPARGQRTSNNCRTLKGKPKTMGSGRTKVDKK